MILHTSNWRRLWEWLEAFAIQEATFYESIKIEVLQEEEAKFLGIISFSFTIPFSRLSLRYRKNYDGEAKRIIQFTRIYRPRTSR